MSLDDRQSPRLTVAAIVPATDDPPTLAECLDAIRRADDPPDELVVVQEPAEAGAGAARNAGARQVTSDLLAFVDADIVVHADVFRRMRAVFEAEPELDAIFGSYDASPTAHGQVSTFRNLLHHHVHQASAGPASTFWTGIGAIRRDVFLEHDGFDEAMPAIEDIELGHRLFLAGRQIRLDPGLQGTHLKRWTLASMVWTDIANRGSLWVAMLLRTRSRSGALNLGWRHQLSAVACVLVVGSAVAGRRKPALAASVAFVALNLSFYRLLARTGGLRAASTGVLLHGVHHLTGIVSVPVGVVRHLLGEVSTRHEPPTS